ncbi:hypothetical protein IWX49DRAFT_586797 [Phyllosticta citricarpa]
MSSTTEPDMSFLDRRPGGQGRLILNAPTGSRHVLQNLSISVIEKDCPVLALAFESSENGTPTADLDVPSIAAGISLVRFIYTRNYAWPLLQDDVPLLPTAHVVIVANSLDYDELYQEAYANLVAKIDNAADFPSPPSDLCATIRFLWEHTGVSFIKEYILSYCIAAFEQHTLGSNPEFIELCQEHFDFHMDLSRVNRERGFEHAGIFQLPGPNRKPTLPPPEDYYIACAFSSNSDEDSVGEEDDAYSIDDIVFESDEDDDEQRLGLSMRFKMNPQVDFETANEPASPTSEASYVMVDDNPFQSTFDTDSESGWSVV